MKIKSIVIMAATILLLGSTTFCAVPNPDDNKVKKLVVEICRQRGVVSKLGINKTCVMKLRNIRIIAIDKKLNRAKAKAEVLAYFMGSPMVFNIIYIVEYTTDGKLYVTVKGKTTKSSFADNNQNEPKKTSDKIDVKKIREVLKTKILKAVSRYVYSNETGIPLNLMDKEIDYGYLRKQNDENSQNMLKRIDEVIKSIPEVKISKSKNNIAVIFDGIWNFYFKPAELDYNIQEIAVRSYDLDILKEVSQGEIKLVKKQYTVINKIYSFLGKLDINKNEFETTNAYNIRVKKHKIKIFKSMKQSGILDKVYCKDFFNNPRYNLKFIFNPDNSTLRCFIRDIYRTFDLASGLMKKQFHMADILQFDIAGILKQKAFSYPFGLNRYAWVFKCSVSQAKQVKKSLGDSWKSRTLRIYQIYDINLKKWRSIKLYVFSQKQIQAEYDSLILAGDKAISERKWKEAKKIFERAGYVVGDMQDKTVKEKAKIPAAELVYEKILVEVKTLIDDVRACEDIAQARSKYSSILRDIKYKFMNDCNLQSNSYSKISKLNLTDLVNTSNLSKDTKQSFIKLKNQLENYIKAQENGSFKSQTENSNQTTQKSAKKLNKKQSEKFKKIMDKLVKLSHKEKLEIKKIATFYNNNYYKAFKYKDYNSYCKNSKITKNEFNEWHQGMTKNYGTLESQSYAKAEVNPLFVKHMWQWNFFQKVNGKTILNKAIFHIIIAKNKETNKYVLLAVKIQ